MPSAKEIYIAPIAAADARALVKRAHYSGRFVNNSQLHLGAFLDGRLEGVMSFGPSMDKSKLQGLVSGTAWNGFLELNRMAFTERLPRNAESRALSVAFRLMRANYPHIEWIVSFADGTQSGDGAIYRASGFVLTQIAKNNSIFRFPDGSIRAKQTFMACKGSNAAKLLYGTNQGETESQFLKRNGAQRLNGMQLRYLYFLSPTARSRLTVAEIPFSEIAARGAEMYRGQPISREKQAMAGALPAQRRGSADLHAPIPTVDTPTAAAD